MDMAGWIQGDISLYSWNCSHLFKSRLLSLVQCLPASCQPIMPIPHKKFNMFLLTEIFRSFTLKHYTGYGFARISQESGMKIILVNSISCTKPQLKFEEQTTSAHHICSVLKSHQPLMRKCYLFVQLWHKFSWEKRLSKSLSRDIYQGIWKKAERMRNYLGSKKLLY